MAVESLAPALACAVVPRRARGRTAVLAGAMVLTEALRSTWPFGGLPMGGVALGQASSPLAGAARLGGPLLLVGLVWLGGGGLAILATAVATSVRRRRGRVGDERGRGRAAPDPRRGGGAGGGRGPRRVGRGGARRRPGASTRFGSRRCRAEGCAACASPRSTRPRSPPRSSPPRTEIAWHDDGGRPRTLVVWPEDVVSLDTPIDGTQTEKQLGGPRRLAARHAASWGSPRRCPTQSFRNEIVAFSPTGRLVARFEKVHRVPFGEYVPYRGFFKHLANLSSVPLDAIPGHGNGVLHTPAGPLGHARVVRGLLRRSAAGSPHAPVPSSSSTPPTPRPTSRARCRPRRSPRPGSRPSPKGATWSRRRRRDSAP